MPVLLLITEADLPKEAYAEIADKMTPLMRKAKGNTRTGARASRDLLCRPTKQKTRGGLMRLKGR